jgi:hypothetical protein
MQHSPDSCSGIMMLYLSVLLLAIVACCLSVALLRTKRRLDAAVADIAELGRWRRANAMHANRAILGELSGENSSMQLSLIFRPRRRGQISAMVTQLAK